MKIILLTLLLASCAQTPAIFPFQNKDIEFSTPDSVTEQPIKVIRREFWQVQNSGNLLRNTPEATLSIWIYQNGEQDSKQDLMGISVGAKNLPKTISRASIRVYPEGRLFAVARAGDREPEQNIMSRPVISKNKWHHVLLMIDYAKDEMRFFLDGNEVPSTGVVDFVAERTSNTPSRTIVIGAEDDGSINHFKGIIKDVRVWRRKLTEIEITTLAKKLKPGEKLEMGM